MADVNALILGVYGTLLHVFEQCLNGLFPSLGRFHGHQMPLVIHVEHWFDIEQVPHNRLAGGKAPAPAELAQISHCEPVAQMGNRLPDKVPDRFNVLPLSLLLHRQVHQKALSH